MIMALGASDTGKSTLIKEAADAILAMGRSVALIDLDLGQGEIGPPCAIHAARLDGDFHSRQRYRTESVDGGRTADGRHLPITSCFIGGITPVGRLLDLCIGAIRLCEAVKEYSPDVVLVDTCGLVSGAVGRALKQRLIEALRPDIVLALQRETELEAILASTNGLSRPRVIRVPVGSVVGRKSPATRATRRAARFLAAFEGAKPVTYAFEEIGLIGQSFCLGTEFGLPARTFIEKSLGSPVLSATVVPDGLGFVVVANDRWNESAAQEIVAAIKCKRLQIVPQSNYAYLVVGMIDREGAMCGIGVIESIDFQRRQLTVLSRCSSMMVAQIRFGNYRARPNGREIGDVRVGDL